MTHDPNNPHSQDGSTTVPGPRSSTAVSVPTTVDTLSGLTSSAARAEIESLLRFYGLESLIDWALGLLTEGAGPSRVELELESQPAFLQRFPAIAARREAGLPPISTDEILFFERQVSELESFYGFPEGTLGEPQDFIIGDTSFNELQGLIAAEVSFRQTDAASQEAFAVFYGIGATFGELVAATINEDIGVPVLSQRIQAASVAGQAQVQGFGDLTREEAEGLVARGVDANAAGEAFSLLARSTQLTTNFTREELLSLAAGEAPAVRQFERRQRTAIAEFSGGGGFAGGTRGLA